MSQQKSYVRFNPFLTSNYQKITFLIPLYSISLDAKFILTKKVYQDTSGLSGKRKKSLFEAWFLVPEVTTLFAKAEHIRDVNELTETNFKILEKNFLLLCSFPPVTQTKYMCQGEYYLLKVEDPWKIFHQHQLH